jgi:soluble cytochrome b562
VREFVAAAQVDVRSGLRAIERAVDGAESGDDVEEILKAIDVAADQALEKLEEHAEGALARLDQVDGLPFKTEQNRRTRIRNRLREMKEAIVEARKDAEKSVRSSSEDAASR